MWECLSNFRGQTPQFYRDDISGVLISLLRALLPREAFEAPRRYASDALDTPPQGVPRLTAEPSRNYIYFGCRSLTGNIRNSPPALQTLLNNTNDADAIGCRARQQDFTKSRSCSDPGSSYISNHIRLPRASGASPNPVALVVPCVTSPCWTAYAGPGSRMPVSRYRTSDASEQARGDAKLGNAGIHPQRLPAFDFDSSVVQGDRGKAADHWMRWWLEPK